MERDEHIALRRQRSEAVQKFLDDNADLFAPRTEEYENEDELDDESRGPIYVTAAMLVIRARDIATGESEFSVGVAVPFALGHTEKIGMLTYALDQLG